MTALNTVKYFKDLGLELIDGDSVISGKSTRLVLTDVKSVAIAPFAIVHSFAWRTNTGEKPAFKGMIEVESASGTLDPRPAGEFGWSKGKLFSITKWRPLLKSQPEIQVETPKEKEALDRVNTPVRFLNGMLTRYVEVATNLKNSEDKWGIPVIKGAWSDEEIIKKVIDNKPVTLVYTQEMAAKGELPPVGSEFLYEGVVATVLSTSKEHGGVVTFTINGRVSIQCCWNNCAWVRPIDTRSDKEKTVDDIVSVLEKASELGEDYKVDATAIYDAGYRKIKE